MTSSHITLVFNLLAAAGWKSIVVMAIAALATTLLRSRSAAARHFVWTLAFAALLILPLLSFTLPALYLPVEMTNQAAIFKTVATPQPATTFTPAVKGAKPQASPAPASRMPDARRWIVLLWALGVAGVLLKTAVAWIKLAAVRRNATPAATPVELARSLGIHRSIEVRETHDRQMPFAFGLLKPAVLMPSASVRWDDERRQVVLLHELAHVQRGDLETHLLARVALAFYWWNPLAWFAWRQFLNERERAADDLVLASGTLPSGYARHLLEIARTMHSAPATAIAIARPSQLEARIRAILDAGINRGTPGRIAAGAAALASICLLVPLAALRAQAPAAPTTQADIDATIRTAQSQKSPELLDSAAKAATSQSKPEIARKLLDASVDVRRQSFGERSPSYAIGLRNLADFNRRNGNVPEAESLYSQAAGLLAGQPESAPALTGLGLCALSSRDSEKAAGYFAQAQAADPERAGMPLTWLAVTQNQNAGDETEKLFMQALALEAPGSADYAATSELYARFLRRHNRDDEGAAVLERARQTRRALGSKPAMSAGVHRAGKGVTMPGLLSKVEPQYSEEARLAKYEGTAVVYAEIGVDGVPHNIQIVSGVGFGLDDKAIEAVNQWRFKPGMFEGQPVTVQANIEINWRLL